MKANTGKRVILGLCGLLCSWSPAGPRLDAADPAASGKPARVDWSLLEFVPNEKCGLRRVKLVMEDFTNQGATGDATFVPAGETLEITDEPTLKRIETALTASVRRTSSGSSGGWGTLCFGRLVVEPVDRREFVIGISGVAFHLGETVPNTGRAFWSGRLAKLTADIYSSRHDKVIRFQGRSLVDSHRRILLSQGGFAGEEPRRR